MNKNKIILLVLLLFIFTIVGAFLWQNFKGAEPAFLPPITEKNEGQNKNQNPNLSSIGNKTDFPLLLPKQFEISVYAKVPDARDMALDSYGNLWVSQTKKGHISVVERETGKVNTVFKNLNNPHGILIINNTLYYAEETGVTRITLYSDDPGQKIVNLPEGGRHSTRSLLWGPDDRIYVSIGSTCDVCFEKDDRIAAIYSMKKDGRDFKKVASGLRNSVFLANNPIDGSIWATEMGRDMLGDDLPPDEMNIIIMGQDYGWPICYGKNILNTEFNSKVNPCQGKTPSHIDLPAHSAPLGLSFIPEEGWPEEYWLDLFVAYHGSWNRSEPTGYKVTRIKIDHQGNYGDSEDFIVGWLAYENNGSYGRPVDIITSPGGLMYVSDDKAGIIYKIIYKTEEN